MLIEGEWYLCSDSAIRPVIWGELLKADNSWLKAPFLVDTGADRTVLNAGVLEELGFSFTPAEKQLAGVGGQVNTVTVDTQIRLIHENQGKALFRGEYAAFTDVAALDMSVLGCDILNLFAVIVDRQQSIVCLVRPPHSYSIALS